jgi:hypothetical protein
MPLWVARQSRFCGVSWLGALVLLPLLVLSLLAGGVVHAAEAARSGFPVIEKARGGACVDDPVFMRRNHMKLLRHQRDDTLRGGIRTGKYSLKECVACHASQTTQSVNESAGDFCQSCHRYAAVTIDCFECHASKPAGSAALAQVQPTAVQEKAKP